MYQALCELLTVKCPSFQEAYSRMQEANISNYSFMHDYKLR